MALARVELVAGWSIELEEGYSREVEPDGTVVLSNDDTTIRATTEGPADRGLGEAAGASEMLGEDLGEPHELSDGTLVAVGDEFEEDIDGAPAWGLAVAAARPNELLSLYFHSHAPGLFTWVPAAAETIAYGDSG